MCRMLVAGAGGCCTVRVSRGCDCRVDTCVLVQHSRSPPHGVSFGPLGFCVSLITVVLLAGPGAEGPKMCNRVCLACLPRWHDCSVVLRRECGSLVQPGGPPRGSGCLCDRLCAVGVCTHTCSQTDMAQRQGRDTGK